MYADNNYFGFKVLYYLKKTILKIVTENKKTFIFVFVLCFSQKKLKIPSGLTKLCTVNDFFKIFF